MTRILLITAIFSLTTALQALTDKSPSQACTLQIDIKDGSRIFAKPYQNDFAITPSIGRAPWTIGWPVIQEVKRAKDNGGIIFSFTNGDQLRGQWTQPILVVDTSFGRLRIPTGQIIHIQQSDAQSLTNIALGKPVSGQDGASHGRGLAKHVTDGDYDTHAKPPGSNFDYTIDLNNDGSDGGSVQSIKIHWGRFGDQFKGIRSADGKGWASASWPGEYVTSYQIHYRIVGSDDWKLCHSASGRPVDEDAKNVRVERFATDTPGCSSESITTINGLDLQGVTEFRIRAGGSHWIGLYELEIWGTP